MMIYNPSATLGRIKANLRLLQHGAYGRSYSNMAFAAQLAHGGNIYDFHIPARRLKQLSLYKLIGILSYIQPENFML